MQHLLGRNNNVDLWKALEFDVMIIEVYNYQMLALSLHIFCILATYVVNKKVALPSVREHR